MFTRFTVGLGHISWNSCRIILSCSRRYSRQTVVGRVLLAAEGHRRRQLMEGDGGPSNRSAGAGTSGSETGVKKRDVLRHIKYKQSHSGNMKPPDFIDVQVVGTGAAGTPRAAFIDMAHLRYLFNCGEGTQRIAMEHKMKLAKLDNIFITHKSWENVGGLLGMALSLEGIGIPKVTIHGPPGTEKLLTMTRGFAQLKGIEIEKADMSSHLYEDTAMKIQYIPLLPAKTSEGQNADIVGPKCGVSGEIDMVVAYLCSPKSKEGSLDIMKCIELGIPRGPLLGKLKAGKEVTLPDGRVVTPDQVVTQHEHAKPFLVIEIPTMAYLPSLLTSDMMKRYQDASKVNSQPQLVIHLSPYNIYTHPDYQQWMKGFDSTTRHLVLNENGSQVAQEATYRIQAQLNLINSTLFPLLPHQTKQREDSFRCGQDDHLVYGCTGLRYTIRGNTNTPTGFHSDRCFLIDNEVYTSEVLADDYFRSELRGLEERIKCVTYSYSSEGQFPEILFLGTGSAIPNKIRNVSGILLKMRSDQIVLLDCGEGTYGQLCRHFGTQTDELLTHLSTVFISHLHADHHMGLFGVVYGRERAFHAIGKVAAPLKVVVTSQINSFLDNLEEHLFPVRDMIRIVPIEGFMAEHRSKEGTAECDQLMQDLSLHKLEFARMRHPQFPYGVALTHVDGWKIAYSGDTMPCTDFVHIGKDCDVLIHEATMEDELETEAKMKRHSTTSQAIDMGLQMNAKFILLTHFSQRYAKVPLFNKKFTDRVGIAFDNMRVRQTDLKVLPILMPALKALFSSDLEDMELRAKKRKLTKQTKQAEEMLKKMKEDEDKESQPKENVNTS